MPRYIEAHAFGDLSYRIEKDGNEYRLWLNGCRIGRPRPDKPAHETREYKTKKITDARKTILVDAKERLIRKAKAYRGELQEIQTLLEAIAARETELQHVA